MGEQTKRIGIARMLLAGSMLLALAALAGILVLDFSLQEQGGRRAAAASPPPSPPEAQAAQGVVRALMFWKPGCHHCEMTIQTVLPPIQQAYGAALDLRMFRVESAEDIEAFFRVAESLGIQPEAAGVPLLVIGDQVLIGTDNISTRLPGLIEMHLAAGGVDLPDTPSLSALLAERGELPTFPDLGSIPQEPLSTPLATQVGSGGTAGSRPEGFALAGGILAGMSLALLYALAAAFSTRVPVPPSSWTERLLPPASLAGLGVAAYLAYVETRLVQAYCGPLGDCNAVQSSPYARLFGSLPVGVLGMAGYLLVLGTWLVLRRAGPRRVPLAGALLLDLAFFAVLFSFYLTGLEMFVIRAVCLWCLSSAILSTLILVLSLSPLRTCMQTLEGLPGGAFDP